MMHIAVKHVKVQEKKKDHSYVCLLQALIGNQGHNKIRKKWKNIGLTSKKGNTWVDKNP